MNSFLYFQRRLEINELIALFLFFFQIIKIPLKNELIKFYFCCLQSKKIMHSRLSTTLNFKFDVKK